MVKTKTENLDKLDLKSLKEKLVEAKQEWFNLKMELSLSKLKDVHAAKKIKQQIARLSTMIRLKELTNKT